MNMQKAKLKDPVEGQNSSLEQDMDGFDLSKLTVHHIPEETARARRPFDGYPLKYTKINGVKMCLTHLVAHNHIGDPVAQDPSNRKVKSERGMEQVLTYHNRSIRDLANGNRSNVAVWFDRPVKTANGQFYFSIVPDEYVRAQLCFIYNNKTQRIEIDKRYLLLDIDQKNRLREVFQQIQIPNQRMERAAQYISGETQETPPEIPEG
jgi:hypothetical protein